MSIIELNRKDIDGVSGGFFSGLVNGILDFTINNAVSICTFLGGELILAKLFITGKKPQYKLFLFYTANIIIAQFVGACIGNYLDKKIDVAIKKNNF